MIPSWLTRYANEDDLREIENAVAAAESRTAGEIVPMVVRESSFSGHVPYIVTLLMFALFMILLPAVAPRLPGPAWGWDLSAGILSLVIGWMSVRSATLRRLFTPAHDQAQSVFHRAQLEFYETGIPATTGKTGVLILVSIHERRAVILGDQSISEKLKPETWVDIINGLLEQMRQGKMREGFTGAIAKVGEILAREFPIQPDDVNELPNTLIVKD